MLNWKSKKLVVENHVKDAIYSSTFLQNETWFALAQSKYVHIYDKTGVELHVLRDHFKSTLLDYLPYHWLLVSGGSSGLIRWHDVSTGKLVSQRNGHNGPAASLRQNPWNAVMCQGLFVCLFFFFLSLKLFPQGHAKGVVAMWTPNMSEPAVKMLCHRGPVVSIAVDRSGNSMVTSGLDSNVNVWDLRTYKKLYSYRTRNSSPCIDISDRGLLSVADGNEVSVYPAGCLSSKQSSYMRVALRSKVGLIVF